MMMTISDFIGHDDAKLALILNAVDPRCGGVLFVGERGSGKSTLARLFRDLLPPGTPFVTLPLYATEEALLGGVDLEDALRTGRRVFRPGLLGRARGGVVYIDDVNLLSPEIMALVLRVQDEGGAPPLPASAADRDAGRYSATDRERGAPHRLLPFILLGSMNPEEGALSPHVLDRFGMCVLWEGLKEPAERLAVMKLVLAQDERIGAGPASPAGGKRSGIDADAAIAAPAHGAPAGVATPASGEVPGDTAEGSAAGDGERELIERIRAARSSLAAVTAPPEIGEYMARQCLESVVAGHRGDVFLFYAARAYAVLSGDGAITRAHVDRVAPLVLLHRRRAVREMEAESTGDHAGDTPPEEREQPSDRGESADTPGGGEAQPRDSRNGELPDDAAGAHRETSGAEEIFGVGQTFTVKRLVFRKDRVNRRASGRRTKTNALGKRGRQIKSILRPNDDIALEATIRAAAPFQRARGRDGMILIREEDLRYKHREKRMGHAVILVVDGSGSMGARRRMEETKGAIQSLLHDCYQKRDRVSLVVFRKDRAELVLPPTASVAAAARRLREIPVGGKTPLAAGLLEAHRLIARERMKSPETRFLVVLVTDGRANQGVSSLPIKEELFKTATLLGELPATDFVVIDTEDKGRFVTTDLACEIAALLAADYYRMEELQAEDMTEIVRMKKITLE